MELFKRVYVGPRAKGRRVKRRGNSLVGENAEIGQYEFGPVLMKIAKKHQPKPLAQGTHHQLINAINRLPAPRGKWLRLRILHAQHSDQIRLLETTLQL
jgi:hypothetical protein